jgi:sugar lactone lactonase YvrE
MHAMQIPALSLESIQPFGRGLHRPECVLAAPNGDGYVPDWRGGVAVIRRDGRVESWLAQKPGIDLKPNGIALLPDGDFLIANLGADGGVWRLGRDGGFAPFLTALEGRPLPPANFVTVDDEERVWITVSTRHRPRQAAWRDGVRDGFVVLVDKAGARIVADGLHYTNEARPDPAGHFLYVVETFGRRLLRYPLQAGGRLGTAQIAVQMERGDLPDGFAFDVEGGIWITSLVSNRVLRAGADGRGEWMIEEANAAHIAAVEEAYAAGAMTAAHLGPVPGTRFQHLTSIAFGGADGRDAMLGTLHGDCIWRFRSPVPGCPQPWWRWPHP